MILSGENNPWKKILPNRDEFTLEKIIPGGKFFWTEMNSPRENNPWKKILLNRDEFTLEKIIPGGGFFRMGMISLWNNNPQWKNLPNEDAYQLGKCIHGQILFSWKICAASHRSIIDVSWEALKVVIRVDGKKLIHTNILICLIFNAMAKKMDEGRSGDTGQI